MFDNLSYVFNWFLFEDIFFFVVLKDVSLFGLMCFIFLEDLLGNDIVRKLLILIREIGKDFDFLDIKINFLIKEEYLEKKGILNKEYLDKVFKIVKII